MEVLTNADDALAQSCAMLQVIARGGSYDSVAFFQMVEKAEKFLTEAGKQRSREWMLMHLEQSKNKVKGKKEGA